jgi:hypothetical protein
MKIVEMIASKYLSDIIKRTEALVAASTGSGGRGVIK